MAGRDQRDRLQPRWRPHGDRRLGFARVLRLPNLSEEVRLIHPIGVRDVALSGDDRFLVVWSGDVLSLPHAARLWLLPLQSLVDEARERLPRNLTLDEWRQHFASEPYHRTCANRPTHVSVLAAILERAKAAAAAGRRRQMGELRLVRASEDLPVPGSPPGARRGVA